MIEDGVELDCTGNPAFHKAASGSSFYTNGKCAVKTIAGTNATYGDGICGVPKLGRQPQE
jgi:hypothetical protein